MKCLRLFCLLIICATFGNAQDTEFAKVDSRMLNIPASMSYSTDSIAAFINKNFVEEKDRLRAIYRWATYNIRYDRDSMYVFNWGADTRTKVSAAMRRRKGVCENYTAVLNDIALKCNLQVYTINGYTKQGGFIDRVGHSWCVANIAKQWLFCDPTWDEGYHSATHYFLISPQEFIESHMPFDPFWQLLNTPVTNEEFYRGNYRSPATDPNAGIAIKKFMEMNDQQRLESVSMRISRAGIKNELIKNQLAFTNMQIALILEDKNMQLYNSAVDDLNKATVTLNAFIEYRNNQFMPEKPGAEMKSLLLPAEEKLVSIEKILTELNQSTHDLQYDAEALKESLSKLKATMRAQQNFLNKWLAGTGEERKEMFYH